MTVGLLKKILHNIEDDRLVFLSVNDADRTFYLAQTVESCVFDDENGELKALARIDKEFSSCEEESISLLKHVIILRP